MDPSKPSHTLPRILRSREAASRRMAAGLMVRDALRAPHHEGLLLPVGLAHLRLDLGHARYPAVVILGLLAHVAEHLRMRQDHEGFLLEAREHVPGHLLG